MEWIDDFREWFEEVDAWTTEPCLEGRIPCGQRVLSRNIRSRQWHPPPYPSERSFNHRGLSDDYVYLICGLLDLYETTLSKTMFQWAEKLQNRQDERFLDSADGGYFTAAGDSSDVLMRLKEHVDGAVPSPNAVAADNNLLRLHQLTGKSLYEQRLNALMQCFAAVLEAQPTTVPNLAVGHRRLVPFQATVCVCSAD